MIEQEDLCGAFQGRAVSKSAALGAPYGHRIQFQKLADTAIMPTQGTPDSAGYDLYASESVRFAPGDRKTIPLGFATALPRDIHARIESRSGMALTGMVVLTGVIDADYRGEWKVIMQNFGRETVRIAAGARVAQAVLRPTLRAAWETTDALEDTSRGGGGFGSTGG